MSNNNSRTNIQDLKSEDNNLSREEMQNIEGGTLYKETRDNPTVTATNSAVPLPPTTSVIPGTTSNTPATTVPPAQPNIVIKK